MDKMLSIRPNKQISSLFAEIQEYQEAANRTEIVNWALEKAIDQKVEWRVVSKLKIKEIEIASKQPEFMQIRVNEGNYDKVAEQIKDAFELKRLTAPYLIKLVLVNYLSSLKNGEKEESISTAEKIVDFGIDCLVFKNAYELSHQENKEELLGLVRIYLEEYDAELNKKIRSQMNEKIKQYSDFFNIEKYSQKPRSNFGTCDIRFVSKSFAGLLLTLVESFDYKIEEIIDSLENTMN